MVTTHIERCLASNPLPCPLAKRRMKKINNSTSEISSPTNTVLSLEDKKKKPNGGLIGGLFLGGAAILAMIVGIRR